MKTTHQVINGDSRRMAELADQSVQLVITSPPYWQLKDYGSENQLGFHHSYEEYINNMNLVWSECHRVLQDGCRLCVNIGDQFARAVYYGRYKIIPIRTEIIKFCEAAGFDYMGAVIWQKVTTTNTSGGASIMGSFPYPRNGILKLDYEFILLFKKPGNAPAVSQDLKERSKLTTEEWNTYFAGHWNFPGERQDGHLAMFPEELPRRLIKMFSFVGDTVLDPFLGSGTTSLAAKNLDRNSVGYEINPDFIPVIERKLGHGDDMLFKDVNLTVRKGDCHPAGCEERIQELPYVFHDPVKFDKKVDPKKFNFGSRIDSDSTGVRDEYYRVKSVLGPNLLLLNNGAEIELLGVRPKEERRDESVAFLDQACRNSRIFLKYDEVRHHDHRLCCYVYLENKTFINAHLIKRGLADVDTSTPFRLQQRFAGYQKEA